MADSVQFVLDRLAHTFRAMEDLEIFTSEEVAAIVKKRTDCEYVLQRRQQVPGDYYNYLQYEINLEKLRILRCSKDMQVHAKKVKRAEEGGKKGTEKIVAALKDRQNAIRNLQASNVRHICTVFERGIRRFPDEIDLVTDYIAFLKDELTPAGASNGAGHDKYLVVSNKTNSSTLAEVFGRALARHPKNESLWIMAAMHEVETNNNVHAARALLQRALRANKTSSVLWKQYFELELWNALKLIARGKIISKPKIDSKGNIVGEDTENSKSKGGKKKRSMSAEGASVDGDVDADAAEFEETLLCGAPLVVFKHALKSVDDVEFALTILALIKSSLPNRSSLYKLCYASATDHFAAREGRNDEDVWRRLLGFWRGLLCAVHSVEAEKGNDSAGSAREQSTGSKDAEREEEPSAKKRKNSSATSPLSTGVYVLEAIVLNVTLFTEVLRDAIECLTAWKKHASAGFSDDQILCAARDEFTAMLKASSHTLQTASAQGRLSLAHSAPSAGSAKRKKGESKSPGGASGDDSSEVGAQVFALQNRMKALLAVLLPSAHSSGTKPPSNALDIAQKIPDAASIACLSIQISQFHSVLNVSEPAGVSGNLLDEKAANNWLLSPRTAETLLGLFSGTGLENPASSTKVANSLTDAINAYASLWSVVGAHQNGPNFAVAFAPFFPLLVYTTEGTRCFLEMVQALSAETNDKLSDICGKSFLDALVSRACKKNSRGELCAAYVQWVRDLKQRRLDAAAPPDSKIKLVESTLRSVHQFVSSKILTVPALVAGGGMLVYFSTVIELAYEIWCEKEGMPTQGLGTRGPATSAGTESSSQQLLLLIRNLGDSALALSKATESADGEYISMRDRIWDVREQVEVRSNHHKEASHIRWRRERD